MILKQTGAALLAATFATGLWAGGAGAQNLDLDEMAAALALPIVTGGHEDQTPWKVDADIVVEDHGDAVTLNTITNGLNTPVLLKIDLIDGDPVDNSSPQVTMETWRSTSFECLLTGRETALFLFKNPNTYNLSGTRDTSQVYVECSSPIGLNDNKAFYTGVANGIMFVAAADPVSGTPISQNVLFGDSIVVDTEDGAAYSFGAITFQAGQGMNDGDKVYRFDGHEYAKFPAVLATNFLAPTSDDSVDAELILFTLDGTVGAQGPRAMVSGLVYNDDEQFTDFQYVFDCFTIVPLANSNDGKPASEPGLDQNFIYDPNSPLGLGSIVGHLELVAQPVASDNDVHDDQYGDGNDTRRRPVHGWIVQEIDDRRVLIPGNPSDFALRTVYTGAGEIKVGYSGDRANWGRPLSQSTTAVVPFLGDQHATLDADPRN